MQDKVIIGSVCCASAGEEAAEFGLVGREASQQVVGGATGEWSDCACV